MADQIILTDASVEVEDEAWPIIGNSVTYTEGLGDKTLIALTQGGKPVMCVSQDVTTRKSMIKFEVPSSIEMMDKTRDTQVKGFGLVIRISGTDAAGNRLGRTFRSAVHTNDPEKAIKNDGTIALEFASSPAVPS